MGLSPSAPCTFCYIIDNNPVLHFLLVRARITKEKYRPGGLGLNRFVRREDDGIRSSKPEVNDDVISWHWPMHV